MAHNNRYINYNFKLSGCKKGVPFVNYTYRCKKQQEISCCFLRGAPSGARTLDPNIKSVVLYQLS